MTPSIERLVQAFRRLPGVGRKTATKYAYAMLQGGSEAMGELAAALADVSSNIVACPECYNWTEQAPCRLCADRPATQICVVEQPGDVIAVEKSGQYRGQYHVLRGLLDPMQGVGLERLTIDQLVARVRQAGSEELILALSPTREGDATCRLIATLLVDIEINLTRLAYGVPLGGQLEYLDEGTLSLAMEHRRSFHENVTC